MNSYTPPPPVIFGANLRVLCANSDSSVVSMDSGYEEWSVQKMNMSIMEPLAELDGGFEPQARARSNTWPQPRPENYVEPDGEAGNKCAGGLPIAGPCGAPTSAAAAAAAKKNSSRRNAWGNLSYADLITQAITSSPDKRLTLSQIYEWMVQNVPYFKDKGDSNSSAGWKNSIRHNLSLHNRFMRVQNEGTGKSSWWMINPDAKPGKSVRRRAASMEAGKFEKRRGRVKKKVEALRNGMADATPSPSSSVSEGLDLFPDSPIHSVGFQLSPDFRPRASSTASSVGRLSPIPALGMEPDWSASQFQNSSYSSELSGGNYSPDQLAGNFEQGMKLHPAETGYMGFMNGQTPQQPPPPYSAPYDSYSHADMNSIHQNTPYGITPQCPVHRIQNCACGLTNQCKVEQMSPTGMSPSYPQSEPSPDPLGGQYMMGRTAMPRPPSSSPPLTPQPVSGMPSTMMGQLMGALNNQQLLDDLNINIESLPGGFECNVDEVIKHELRMEGTLDFNFSNANHQNMPLQQEVNNAPPAGAPPAYSTTVTTPSWVH